MASSCLSSPLQTSRHCAYCLIPISGQEVQLCGGCGRRAYCSKNCQLLDWKPIPSPITPNNRQEQRGQGHRNWCHLLCLEEDLDWKVVPIEGKGLGIIALKPIPIRSRIIVEGCQLTPQSHPGIQDLVPVEEGSNLQAKWELNKLGCGDDEEDVLCVRMARVNHDCNPNAGHVFCKTFQVKILGAERDIAPGEEISINYQCFKMVAESSGSLSEDKVQCQQVLRVKWGINCPPRCICNDAQILAEIKLGMELDEGITKFMSDGGDRDVERALGKVKELLGIHERNSTFPERTLYHGFQIGIMTKSTLPQGLEYLNQLVALMGDTFHPESALVLADKELLRDPSTHENYLILDDGDLMENS